MPCYSESEILFGLNILLDFLKSQLENLNWFGKFLIITPRRRSLTLHTGVNNNETGNFNEGTCGST